MYRNLCGLVLPGQVHSKGESRVDALPVLGNAPAAAKDVIEAHLDAADSVRAAPM
jgi:hypothetical protein